MALLVPVNCQLKNAAQPTVYIAAGGLVPLILDTLIRGQGGVCHLCMCAQFHVGRDVQKKRAWIHAYAHFDTSEFICAYDSFWVLAYAKFQ